MKAITIYQPWASLIPLGAKKIETRSWATKYRGPIAIHAGLKPIPRDYYGIRDFLPCVCDFPYGRIIAIADLVDCLVIDGYGHDLNWLPGENDAESKFYYAYPANIKEPKAEDFIRIGYPETMFGYYPDCGFKKEPRYAWRMDNVRPIEPVPAKGMQRLWEWEGIK